MARTLGEKIIDKLLLLQLIDVATTKGRVEGSTKLQKLVFLTENHMIAKKMKGFNYTFIRFTHGPYSSELGQDFNKLVEVELVTEGKNGIVLTADGKKLLESCETLFHVNKEILESTDTVLDRFANQSLQKILAFVYAMPYPRRKKTIGELSQKEPILFKMNVKRAKTIFKIDSEWLESLDILFEPRSYNLLKESMKAAKEKPMLTHKEVFG